MTGRQPWEELVEAEASYVEARVRLFGAGATSQLALALESPRGRAAALRVLRDAPPDLVMALLGPLFAAATTTHVQVGLAREIIANLDVGWRSFAMRPLVSEFLRRDDLDWSDYRRLAELLAELDQGDLLATVVEQASTSPDLDVREVADDYERVAHAPADNGAHWRTSSDPVPGDDDVLAGEGQSGEWSPPWIAELDGRARLVAWNSSSGVAVTLSVRPPVDGCASWLRRWTESFLRRQAEIAEIDAEMTFFYVVIGTIDGAEPDGTQDGRAVLEWGFGGPPRGPRGAPPTSLATLLEAVLTTLA